MENLLFAVDIIIHIFAILFALLYLYVCNFRMDSDSEIKKSTIKRQLRMSRTFSLILAVAVSIFAGVDIEGALARTASLLQMIVISWIVMLVISLVALILLMVFKPHNLKSRIAGVRTMIVSSLITILITLVMLWLFT